VREEAGWGFSDPSWSCRRTSHLPHPSDLRPSRFDEPSVGIIQSGISDFGIIRSGDLLGLTTPRKTGTVEVEFRAGCHAPGEIDQRNRDELRAQKIPTGQAWHRIARGSGPDSGATAERRAFPSVRGTAQVFCEFGRGCRRRSLRGVPAPLQYSVRVRGAPDGCRAAMVAVRWSCRGSAAAVRFVSFESVWPGPARIGLNSPSLNHQGDARAERRARIVARPKGRRDVAGVWRSMRCEGFHL